MTSSKILVKDNNSWSLVGTDRVVVGLPGSNGSPGINYQDNRESVIEKLGSVSIVASAQTIQVPIRRTGSRCFIKPFASFYRPGDFGNSPTSLRLSISRQSGSSWVTVQNFIEIWKYWGYNVNPTQHGAISLLVEDTTPTSQNETSRTYRVQFDLDGTGTVYAMYKGITVDEIGGVARQT